MIGLLCDPEGRPVSTEVFQGNTQDPTTFAAQVTKASQRFGCEQVTFVGDRGMIKSGQIEDLARVGFHYITAITKPQIEVLLQAGALQMELFTAQICEVQLEDRRYVLRRNPLRAAQMAASRADKQASAWSRCGRRWTPTWPLIRGPRWPRRRRRCAPRSLDSRSRTGCRWAVKSAV